MFDENISEGDIVELSFMYDNIGKVKIALDISSANMDAEALFGTVIMSKGVPFDALDNKKLIIDLDKDIVVNNENFHGYHVDGIGSDIKILSV